MTLTIKQSYADKVKRPIPVFNIVRLSVNGKKQSLKLNRNPRLDWDGKALPKRFGGFNEAREAGMRGNY
jgi:hypothetical protein